MCIRDRICADIHVIVFISKLIRFFYLIIVLFIIHLGPKMFLSRLFVLDCDNAYIVSKILYHIHNMFGVSLVICIFGI